MELTGADIVMECMLEQGVDTVFGYPGGSMLYVYDALYRYQDKIRHILTAHEQGAAHAADGYARSSGRCGVVFATSGPGATNLVTGIATAYMDSVPMVAITCNVSTHLLGKDSFQEIDIVGITMPITKHNFLVKKAEDIAPAIRRAFQIAKTGRPGPVLVDITKDATVEMTEYTPAAIAPVNNDTVVASKADMRQAIKRIKKSRCPLIYAGGGVIAADATEELKRFQTLLDAPVVLSGMGLGGFPADDPAFCGMVGMHGTQASAFAVQDCDLLIAVGARFSDRVTCDTETFARGAGIIHIDADAAEIGKNVRVDVPLVGDAKAVLDKLSKMLEPQSHPRWMEQIAGWKKAYPLPVSAEDALSPRCVIRTLYEMTEGDAIVTTDVGQHQMWTAQFYEFNKPRRFLSSGGLGTMGFGLGAAIGAKIVNPEKTVINITGDGCFHMNMNELSTAAEQKLPIVEVIMNNQALGMVRQWQKMFCDKRFSSTNFEKKTDYEMVAKGLGARAFTVTCEEELRAAVKAALAETDTPTVINCIIDPDQMVLPMVPGGMPIEEAIVKID